MVRRLSLGIILAAAVSLIPGPAQAIVYGQLDGNRHPNVGAFVYQRANGTFGALCSGSLIDDDVFLTAAHCTAALVERDIAPEDVWVTFDPTFDQSSPLLPATYHHNPAYNGSQSDPHDVAVLVLDDPVTGITPVELPAEGLLSRLRQRHQLRNRTFTAVGYGTVRTTRKTGFQGIQDDDDRRFALQHATTLTQAWLKLSMNQATNNGGTCYGDSGGPHFLGGAASNLQVSLTVTGDAVCKASDVTYRLDTPSARSFLDDFVTLP